MTWFISLSFYYYIILKYIIIIIIINKLQRGYFL